MRLASQDRRRLLMDAALELFARQGYTGTTTRQIARQAGVTEAIIYRHFPNKEELYFAVLEEQCTRRRQESRVQDLLQSEEDDLTVFAAIAEEMLRRNLEDGRLPRLLLYSALENHQLSQRIFRTHISPHFELLAARIRRRIAEGGFRPTDPLLAARGFLGMVIYHYWIEALFGGKPIDGLSVQQVSRTLAGIWLQGMAAGAPAVDRTGNGSNGTHTRRARKAVIARP